MNECKIYASGGYYLPVDPNGRPLCRKPLTDLELAKQIVREFKQEQKEQQKAKGPEGQRKKLYTDYEVECIETGKRYRDAGAAAKDCGIKHVASVCIAIQKGWSVSGLHFCRVKRKNYEGWAYCLETGDKFRTAVELAEYFEISVNMVRYSIQTGKPRGGYHFGIIGKPIPEWKAPKYKNGKIPTRIQCIETGQVFENAKAAGEAFGATHGAIYHATNKGGRCAGYHFRKVQADE